MSSLPPDSLSFVEAHSKVRGGNTGIKVHFRRQDGEGRLNLSREQINWPFWGEGEDTWQVRFSRNIPLTLDVKSAASNLNLGLDELQVTKLRLDIDVSNCRVKMPSSAGTTHAYIKADLANLEVIIPDGVAARLRTDVSLGHIGVDESRFPSNGDYYTSQDFESAESRIELEIDCDIGRVQVK